MKVNSHACCKLIGICKIKIFKISNIMNAQWSVGYWEISLFTIFNFLLFNGCVLNLVDFELCFFHYFLWVRLMYSNVLAHKIASSNPISYTQMRNDVDLEFLWCELNTYHLNNFFHIHSSYVIVKVMY